MADQLFISEKHNAFHKKAWEFTQKNSLAQRAKLPDEFQFLLKKYPHAMWTGHANLSGLLHFWLNKHSEFNQVCENLNKNNPSFLAGSITPQFFQKNIAPKINRLLSEFTEHHHIEDHFTFPILRREEPALGKAFDILDADHIALTNSLQRVTQVSNNFMQSQKREDRLSLGESFVRENSELARLLKRHLMDEEEIVIPLFLDRGEQILSA